MFPSQDLTKFNLKELDVILQLALKEKKIHLVEQAVREGQPLFWPHKLQATVADTVLSVDEEEKP